MSYQRLSGILILGLLASWGVFGLFIWHSSKQSEAVSETKIEQSIEENHSEPDNSSTVVPTENQASETVESEQTNQSTDEKSAVVQDFVTTYFNTKDEPFLKDRVSLLNEKKLITDEYNQEMTQSIGDMDNEDAKMSVEDLRVYTNDDQTYFVVFDLKYEGLDSNQVLVYVASAHVSDSNQIDHYELIATNTKLKKGNE